MIIANTTTQYLPGVDPRHSGVTDTEISRCPLLSALSVHMYLSAAFPDM